MHTHVRGQCICMSEKGNVCLRYLERTAGENEEESRQRERGSES